MAHGGAAVPRRSRDTTWRRPVGATYAVGYGTAMEVARHGAAEADLLAVLGRIHDVNFWPGTSTLPLLNLAIDLTYAVVNPRIGSKGGQH